MKEYLKWIKIWLGIFSILIILWIVTFFVIKSRTATDPGLWDNGTSLYTSVNETLTAAKRNALVKKANTPLSWNYIICTRNQVSGYTASAGSNQTITFTASECWWTLPNSNYVWIPIVMRPGRGHQNFNIQNASPHVTISQLYSCTNSNLYIVILYLKVY